MSVAIFSPTPYINKWQMSLCTNSSDNKSYRIHRVDVKVSAQVTTVTYKHQSQPSLHSLRKHFTVHLELWPGNHFIWCNATFRVSWGGIITISYIYLFLTPNSQSVFRAGVSLNIHSFIVIMHTPKLSDLSNLVQFKWVHFNLKQESEM